MCPEVYIVLAPFKIEQLTFLISSKLSSTAMKLSTAALALLASTYGSTTAFVPSFGNVVARRSKAPALFMSSEAPAAEAPTTAGETFEYVPFILIGTHTQG